MSEWTGNISHNRPPIQSIRKHNAGPAHGLFVTGADTGVGKTAVAAALADWLRQQGTSVRVRKPIESGAIDDRHGHPQPADAILLRRAAGAPEPLQRVCPFPLPEPVSPQRAAELAGIRVTLDDLHAACLNGLDGDEFLLVEGAGGFCSPLTADALNADLATRLGLPLLLVVGDRLGCINHSLLTLEAADRRGLVVAAVVLNRRVDTGAMDNARDLADWCRAPLVSLPAVDEREPWRHFPESTLERLGALVMGN